MIHHDTHQSSQGISVTIVNLVRAGPMRWAFYDELTATAQLGIFLTFIRLVASPGLKIKLLIAVFC